MFKYNPTKFFVYCALIFGILFMTIIPPFQSPDEDSHFKRAYVLSYGKLYPTTENGVVGYELPTEMVDYINEKITYIGDREKKYTYNEQIIDDRLPKNYEEKIFQNFSTAETMPYVYVAPAIGIIFSRIIEPLVGLENISIVNMLYFARFFSLILYIVLIAIAIEKTPILKKTFCMIGLIPMSLSLAAAISYDSVLIALSLLSTSLIFKLIFDNNIKKINFKYIITFGIIGFILLSVKTVYITLLFPLIFIPKEKLGTDKKSIIKFFTIIIGISLGAYILNKIPALFLDKVSNSDTELLKQQLGIVIKYPIYYLKIWLKTMVVSRNFYLCGMFGIFGLADTYILSVYTVFYLISFIIIAIADFSLEEKRINIAYKIIAVLGTLISIFGIFLAMYLMWTSVLEGYGVGANEITGVQGRYFIPLIPLIIVVFSNGSLIKNKKVKSILTSILKNSYIVTFIMLLVSSIAILLRFWC